MKHEVVIIMAEDDEGHAALMERNLRRSGLTNEIIKFKDGEETLNFFLREGEGPHRVSGVRYILLLDIRMPKVDGVTVLRRLKQDPELIKIPVIILTTTDDPREVGWGYGPLMRPEWVVDPEHNLYNIFYSDTLMMMH